MTGLEIYFVVFLIIFAINVVPAFMPPTWIILSYFFIEYNLAFLPTVIIGVIAATSGRVVLALIAGSHLKKYLPKKFTQNYDDLGGIIKKHQKVTIPVALGYAFSPISSNSLFIMAGLSGLNLGLIAVSFFIGRLATYSFWVATSARISHRLDDIFVGSFSNLGGLISALVSLAIIIAIGKIPWRKVIKR